MGVPVIEIKDVSVRFTLNKEKVDNLKEYVIKALRKELHYQEFWALKDINLVINKGERIGILGLNGAGKSVLLKVISGIYKPTTGTVKTTGRIAPLIELGAGFDPNYTGRENIFLNGAVLGYPRSYLAEKFNEIVEFSELGEFIDVPLKNYSSGMRARLGFSIATIVEPDILIIDEVLSVGDMKFRKKSEEKMMSLINSGVTVLFVSHSLEQVKRVCDKAVWLEKGRIKKIGDIQEICSEYEAKYKE